ncbi:hypothetical protein K490DRAFT_60159 [Saccharata proteae CBS 121410]|uniref:Uncharacterized protein n=1 Tax=Saccharata proteae CBS 121410 TaxID=1314787 RepID=A0A9P4LW93_9PEZI|nr:hypothetical protein K490DRAFT_60159 [Saccharata proteae CBS 121410]
MAPLLNSAEPSVGDDAHKHSTSDPSSRSSTPQDTTGPLGVKRKVDENPDKQGEENSSPNPFRDQELLPLEMSFGEGLPKAHHLAHLGILKTRFTRLAARRSPLARKVFQQIRIIQASIAATRSAPKALDRDDANQHRPAVDDLDEELPTKRRRIQNEPVEPVAEEDWPDNPKKQKIYPPTHLLGLPQELRDMILEPLLNLEGNHLHINPVHPVMGLPAPPRPRFETQILRVCRQLRDEGNGIVYGKTTAVVEPITYTHYWNKTPRSNKFVLYPEDYNERNFDHERMWFTGKQNRSVICDDKKVPIWFPIANAPMLKSVCVEPSYWRYMFFGTPLPGPRGDENSRAPYLENGLVHWPNPFVDFADENGYLRPRVSWTDLNDELHIRAVGKVADCSIGPDIRAPYDVDTSFATNKTWRQHA